MIRLVYLAVAGLLFLPTANAQENLSSVSLKSDESKVIGRASFFSRAPGCVSLLAAIGKIDILQSNPAVAITIREQSVQPPQCGSKKVKGGAVIATASKIERPYSGKLIYRIHYKTLGGSDVVWSHRLDLNLEP